MLARNFAASVGLFFFFFSGSVLTVGAGVVLCYTVLLVQLSISRTVALLSVLLGITLSKLIQNLKLSLFLSLSLKLSVNNKVKSGSCLNCVLIDALHAWEVGVLQLDKVT